MAKSEKYAEHKLKAIGLLKVGYNAKEVARELGIPYPNVLKWKPEADAIETKEELAAVLDTDKVVLHELAERVADEFEEIAEGSGELVAEVVDKIDQLGLLQTDLQGSGRKLIAEINRRIEDCQSADDILAFVEAIAKLQNAFFAKGANVNVLNVPGQANGPASDSNISKYQSLMRPA